MIQIPFYFRFDFKIQGLLDVLDVIHIDSLIWDQVYVYLLDLVFGWLNLAHFTSKRMENFLNQYMLIVNATCNQVGRSD